MSPPGLHRDLAVLRICSVGKEIVATRFGPDKKDVRDMLVSSVLRLKANGALIIAGCFCTSRLDAR